MTDLPKLYQGFTTDFCNEITYCHGYVLYPVTEENITEDYDKALEHFESGGEGHIITHYRNAEFGNGGAVAFKSITGTTNKFSTKTVTTHDYD